MMEAENGHTLHTHTHTHTFVAQAQSTMASAGDDEDDGMDFFEMIGIKNQNRMDGASTPTALMLSIPHVRAPSKSLVQQQSFIFTTHFLPGRLAFHHPPTPNASECCWCEYMSVAMMSCEFIFCVRCAAIRCETTREGGFRVLFSGCVSCGRRRIDQQFCPSAKEKNRDG